MIATCFIINFFNPRLLQAQEVQKPAETKSAVHLNEKQWKEFEGIFQSSNNKEMYVQLSDGENMLVAKLLWNNNVMHLVPETELTFISKESEDEGPLHVRFTRDSAGIIANLSVGNNDVWNRVKDYKPVVKKEMQHTSEQLKPFEGLYQFSEDKNRFIQFSVKNNNLVLKQHWDGNEIPFVPESELGFFSKVAPLFSLMFTKDKDGTITQVLAFKKDLWDKVKKISPTNEQLKAIEGKYQFKDDKDNYIQIMARDNNLAVKQLWDNKEIVLEPQTETYFYNNDQSYPLQVIKDKEGKVIQVLVLGIDLFDKVKD